MEISNFAAGRKKPAEVIEPAVATAATAADDARNDRRDNGLFMRNRSPIKF